MKIKAVWSGGQTGADQGGLAAGKKAGLETGGYAPKGWETEDGPNKTLLRSYGLKEYTVAGYPPRTRMNILSTDFTIIIAQNIETDRGSGLTLRIAEANEKPFWHFKPGEEIPVAKLKKYLRNVYPEKAHLTVNIAGNRESKSPGIYEATRKMVYKFLVEFNGRNV